MNVSDWFTGVVEDVNDPTQTGRVRVRCFGYHNPSLTDIPTGDLPWASCLMPVTSPCISGIGQSPTGLMPGSWVFGVFRDGRECQDPFILGSIPSNSSPGNGGGFSDPHLSYPNTSGPDIPSGATSYGYATASVNQNTGAAQYGTAAVGSGGGATTLQPPGTPVSANGSLANLIAIARKEIGVRETSTDRGPGIEKYWKASNSPGGYGGYWCAVYVCWVVQQSGIFSEKDRPKSPSCFRAPDSIEAWGRKSSPATTLTTKPTQIKAGDIVIFSSSHIGIATGDSDAGGGFMSIEGNTTEAGSRNGIAVVEKRRKISALQSSIRINVGS